MSIEYDVYLKKHISFVQHGFSWIMANVQVDVLNDILPDLKMLSLGEQLPNHDKSKYSRKEYDAYDSYFYKNGNETYDGNRNFDYAWLHHIHHNPHHWQFWVLIEDDGNGQLKPLDIPDNYIIEMICDWWSFSWKEYLESMRNGVEAEPHKHLYEIFDWYENHKATMYLSENTRIKVEKLLDILREALDRRTNEDIRGF